MNLPFDQEDEFKENELEIPLFLKEYGLIYNFDRTKIDEEPSKEGAFKLLKDN